MTWMTTASGTDHSLSRANLLDAEYSIEDIAHAGAQINRYNGHTRRPMCINEHQLLCADIAEHLNLSHVVTLACLVHDAHEVYTGDTISPVKWALGHAWDEFENPIATHMRRWLRLHSTFTGHRAVIRQIDLMALATERRDLLNYQPGRNKPWPILDTPGSVVPCADWIDLNTTKREQTHWTEWKAMWLERYHALSNTAYIPCETTEAL